MAKSAITILTDGLLSEVPIPAVTAPSLSLNDFTGLFSGLAPSAAPVSSGSSAAAASGPSAAAAGG